MRFEERSAASRLEREPDGALTIDSEAHPPKILLIRDEYLQATSTYEIVVTPMSGGRSVAVVGDDRCSVLKIRP